MPWRPAEPGDVPTLGWIAIDFAESLLAAPEREEYEPLQLTQEMIDFFLGLYELDPVTGQRIVTRAALSRPRGWGKSPVAGVVGLFEALGDAYPDGWDADGQPVGMPWKRIRKPNVHLFGVSEQQTANAWDPIRDMIRAEQQDSPIYDEFPQLDPYLDVIQLGNGALMEKRTSAAQTVKGGKPVCVLLDQTEEYTTTNGGIRVANTAINNAVKRGGLALETPNAYIPGSKTQAEATANAANDVKGGRALIKTGFLWDHREAPADTDLADEESLVRGLRIAYGDSSDHPDGCLLHDPPCAPGWAPITSIRNRIWQPDADEQLMRSDYLNQITHASDAYVSFVEWGAEAVKDEARRLLLKDVIALGFDGSRAKAKGKPDATALVACRLSDGFLWEVGVWEAPDIPSTWKTWQPDTLEIEASIAEMFQKYRVVRFYCDPAKDWRSHVNGWESKYAKTLYQPDHAKKQPNVQHPFEWWMTGGRATLVERAVEALYAAIANGEVKHANQRGLTKHMLNARRRIVHQHLALGKEFPSSQNKIDAAVAAVLAFQGALDGIAAGVLQVPRKPAFALPSRVY